MTDSQTRSAARAAAFAAIPIALIVGVLTFWWMSGRTSPSTPHLKPRPQSTAPVAATAAPLSGPAAASCRDLLSKVPTGLRDRPRRPVTAGADQNAAYGDPPITLTCGVPALTLPVGADVYVLSGVCWYSAPDGDDTVWTTVDRDTPVRVRVPNSYSSPGQWVIEFSPAVTAALPRSAATPPGC